MWQGCCQAKTAEVEALKSPERRVKSKTLAGFFSPITLKTSLTSQKAKRYRKVFTVVARRFRKARKVLARVNLSFWTDDGFVADPTEVAATTFERVPSIRQ